MKVILKENLEDLGKIGDIVRVSPPKQPVNPFSPSNMSANGYSKKRKRRSNKLPLSWKSLPGSPVSLLGGWGNRISSLVP